MAITESEAEVAIDTQLYACGWQLDPRKQNRNVYKQQPRTPEQKKALGSNRPDYVLYADPESDKPTVVIEAKKPGKSMSDALDASIKKYASRIKAPIAIATDGWRVKTWHLEQQQPLLIDGHEVDELFSPEMAVQFIRNNDFSSFTKEIALTQDELIAKFKQANIILKNEGFSAGVERFSEFANLMFLKLHLEKGTHEIAGLSWPDIEQKQGTSLIKAIKNMFAELKRKQKLFTQTRIKNPQRMEKLIELLSSFRLTSVRGDIKGIAFEHFIHSYTRGAKNDLGQYFTPRHIVRMMVHFLKPQIGEKIYDPFCGTGGMLIECFRYISQHINKPADKKRLKEKTLFGRDNSSVARIAMMNMIMFGDGHSNITQADSYALLGDTKNKYDIVITNIPFSQATDHCEGYPVMPSGKKNGDSIAVQHCLESLKKKETARAAIIVPIGFLYKKQLQEERKHILDKWNVERIVELSPKCFQPYTEQQTAVLVLNRQKNRKKFYPYYQVKNDGYSQDGYRVPIHGENDIDKTMDNIGACENPTNSDKSAKFKFIDILVKQNEFPLRDIANVFTGSGDISPKTKIADIINGISPVMMVADLAKNHIDYFLTESNYKLTTKAIQQKTPHLFPKHTTFIPITGKSALKNHRALLGRASYATSTLAGIEAKPDKTHPYCLFYFFLNFDIEKITYDLGYPGITKETLEKIGIPNYTEKQVYRIVQRVKDTIELSKELKEKRGKIENPK